jgi:hypothetical protein
MGGRKRVGQVGLRRPLLHRTNRVDEVMTLTGLPRVVS